MWRSEYPNSQLRPMDDTRFSTRANALPLHDPSRTCEDGGGPPCGDTGAVRMHSPSGIPARAGAWTPVAAPAPYLIVAWMTGLKINPFCIIEAPRITKLFPT